jgi:glutamate dehydrogenase
VPYISFKILSELLQSLVPTRLRAEVWVQSARMAGIHMRRGPVSRGGLRHSDRPDDLRTEVLGLVRTQSVKNCVIVPAGSKGGFVIRRHRSDPQQAGEEVVAQYRTLIRGLLDVTDNLVEQRAWCGRTPGRARRGDPYLVVAADKGTAKFSDVANEVAAEYGFWLGDAFASGGSNGYDHKGVGITARGAWECVRRHFRELGDIQTEPFTVVGIGDMSGDVFGNGMLLSRRDPAHRRVRPPPHLRGPGRPTPAASFAERQRLFALGRSSWATTTRRCSARAASSCRAASSRDRADAEAAPRSACRRRAARMDGETLIRARSCARAVDLLWNGGIGTYVKAPASARRCRRQRERRRRIDASELRCRVLGEGGNLGLTQRARVQFALNGGRCYTDAIDNSGGVEMSDREVNLKILLNAAVRGPARPRRAQRAAARADRRRHGEGAARQPVAEPGRLARRAARGGRLRGLPRPDGRARAEPRDGPRGEALPSLEVLTERRARGQSLTRPELSVLLAYAKLTLKQALLSPARARRPAMERYLAATSRSAPSRPPGRPRWPGTGCAARSSRRSSPTTWST